MSRRCRRGCVCLCYGLRHAPLVNNLQNPRVTWISTVRRRVLDWHYKDGPRMRVAHHPEDLPPRSTSWAASGRQCVPQSHTKAALTTMDRKTTQTWAEPSSMPWKQKGPSHNKGGIPRRCQCETATAVWHGPHHTNSRMPPNLATQLRSGVTWCTRGPRQPPNCRPWMWAGHCDRRHIATATQAARRTPDYAEGTGSAQWRASTAHT